MVVRTREELPEEGALKGRISGREGDSATLEAISKEETVKIPEAEKKKIIEELREVASPERVRDELYVRVYYRGTAFCINAKNLADRIPELVVYPQTQEEVKGILKIASKYKVPVTVVGTQTTMMGARPLKGGIVLDIMGMKQIHKIDFEHGYAVVEPGVTIEQIMEEIRPKGYTLAVGHFPVNFSVVSTLVAYKADHNMTNKMWDQVVGVEMTMPDGTILYTGTEIDADAELWTDVQHSFTGLKDLLGPHGATLGVITRAAVRIWPLLDKTAVPVFGFDNFESAARWSHAMAKSPVVDQAMVANWVYLGGPNYSGLPDRFLDFIEARMKYDQEETPTELGIFNCYGWVGLRGYEEEVDGALAVAKRLAKQFGGKYLPEEELAEKMPGALMFWRNQHRDLWPEWWGGPEPRLGPQTEPEIKVRAIVGTGGLEEAMSATWTGPIGEIIKMYSGIAKKWRDYGYKNFAVKTRMYNSGQAPWLRFIVPLDGTTEKDLQESLRIRDEVTQWVLQNYSVVSGRMEFPFNDPQNPRNVTERAKPVRRLLSAVQKEFDPENIMNPVHKKYTLL